MSMEKFKTVFEDAARDLGFSGAELDERGACTILPKVQGMPAIHLAYDEAGDNVDIFCELGTVPDGRADLYREFLAANLFGEESKGAVFAFSRELGHVVLQRTLSVEAIGEHAFFASALADFAEVAYAARQKLFDNAPDAAESSGQPMGESQFTLRV